MVSFKSLATFGLTLAATSAPVHAFSSYISQWIPVNYTVEGNFDNRTFYAQQEIVAAAKWWSNQGPWCECALFSFLLLCAVKCAVAARKSPAVPSRQQPSATQPAPAWQTCRGGPGVIDKLFLSDITTFPAAFAAQ